MSPTAIIEAAGLVAGDGEALCTGVGEGDGAGDAVAATTVGEVGAGAVPLQAAMDNASDTASAAAAPAHAGAEATRSRTDTPGATRQVSFRNAHTDAGVGTHANHAPMSTTW
jgi:hypothetical protein